jgi:hypothetical protein
MKEEGGRGMQHAWVRWETHTKFWSEKIKGGDHFGDLGSNETIILKWILGKKYWKIEFNWLRCGPMAVLGGGVKYWSQNERKSMDANCPCALVENHAM